MSKSTIFGEESFFNKQMVTFYKAQDNMVYDKMSSAIKMYMPQVEINREQLERWVNLCIKLDNIDNTDLIDMAIANKFNELKDQLAFTEKALELACDYLVSTGDDELFKLVKDIYNDDVYLETKINYFKTKAKEMMKSE